MKDHVNLHETITHNQFISKHIIDMDVAYSVESEPDNGDNHNKNCPPNNIMKNSRKEDTRKKYKHNKKKTKPNNISKRQTSNGKIWGSTPDVSLHRKKEVKHPKNSNHSSRMSL